MTGFPLPGTGRVAVAVPAPAAGPGSWAGAPSAGLDDDGTLVVAYRIRVVDQDVAATVVARAPDGEHLTAVATLDKARFGAMSLERPALVRTDAGRWRLYVSCATLGSKHWWIDVLEAADPAGFADADARTVFPGDDRTGVKDPVIRHEPHDARQQLARAADAVVEDRRHYPLPDLSDGSVNLGLMTRDRMPDELIDRHDCCWPLSRGP